jgi:hypothetical protein
MTARRIGLLVPPAAWALSTQLGQIFPYIDCRQEVPWTAAFCGVLLLISIAGVALSRAFSSKMEGTNQFIARTGFFVALAFVFALLLQGAASMLLDPCQH